VHNCVINSLVLTNVEDPIVSTKYCKVVDLYGTDGAFVVTIQVTTPKNCLREEVMVYFNLPSVQSAHSGGAVASLVCNPKATTKKVLLAATFAKNQLALTCKCREGLEEDEVISVAVMPLYMSTQRGTMNDPCKSNGQRFGNSGGPA
jgi:hypothetical protein